MQVHQQQQEHESHLRVETLNVQFVFQLFRLPLKLFLVHMHFVGVVFWNTGKELEHTHGLHVHLIVGKFKC